MIWCNSTKQKSVIVQTPDIGIPWTTFKKKKICPALKEFIIVLLLLPDLVRIFRLQQFPYQSYITREVF